MTLKLFPFFKMKKNRKSYDNQFTAKPLKLYVIWRIEYQDKVNQNKPNAKYQKPQLEKWKSAKVYYIIYIYNIYI